MVQGKVKVVKISPEGRRTFEQVRCNLDYLNKAVGGHIEAVSGRDWTCYCNEEGKLMGLPINLHATLLLAEWGVQLLPHDVLVGTVVLVGNGEAGEAADLPEHLLIALGGQA